MVNSRTKSGLWSGTARQRASAANAHQNSAHGSSLQCIFKIFLKVVHGCFSVFYFIEVGGLPGIGQAIPEFLAYWIGATGRVDAQQPNAPDYERHHRCPDAGAAGHAAGGNRAPRSDHARKPGKHVTADIVYGARPVGGFQRLFAPIEVLAADAL